MKIFYYKLFRYWLLFTARRQNINLEKNTKILKPLFIGKYIRICKNTIFKNSIISTHSYIGENCNFNNTAIGSFTSIGKNVSIIFGKHPVNEFVSTHPVFYSTRKQIGITYTDRQIFDDFTYTENGLSLEIGNDVWIGEGVKFVEGVKVGDGAVIGSYSLVTKDVEPYSINVGVSAKNIRYRYSKDQINWLIKFKWWDKDIKWIEENSKYFNDIEEFIKIMDKQNDKL